MLSINNKIIISIIKYSKTTPPCKTVLQEDHLPSEKGRRTNRLRFRITPDFIITHMFAIINIH